MLEYLKEIKGRSILIEWPDFSQEGEEYRLAICKFTGTNIPKQELTEENRVCISYLNGSWKLSH
jgi:hypothetical protein